MSAPMQEKFPLISSYFLVIFYFISCLCSESENADEFLLCRTCGHEIAKAADLIKMPSIHALKQRNDTILGQKHVLIQLFKNPQGAMFEVVTVRDHDAFTHDQAFAEYSWYPGYTWQVSICPRCGIHLGWFFKPIPISDSVEQQSFLGLILEKVIHKSLADSILIIPKAVRS